MRPSSPAPSAAPSVAPGESLASALPEILAALRGMQARKLRVLPLAGGGFEVEVVEANRLYVSRQELAEMLPMFSRTSCRAAYVDRLVALGLPHVNATGSRLYNVPRCVEWLERHFGCGGRVPARE